MKIKKFRLPRKTKKKISGIIWFYPPNEKGSRQVAFPCKSQEHYNDYKKGILEDLLKSFKEKYYEKIN